MISPYAQINVEMSNVSNKAYRWGGREAHLYDS